MRRSGEKLSRAISLLSKWIACVGLLLMTVIIAVQVFTRYLLNDSPVWAEQAALLLMIWYVFIAAAAGVREGFHIRIGVLADSLPAGPRRVVHLLSLFLVAVFGAAMAVYGLKLAFATWQHVIPTLGVSRGFAYVPIALSGVLIAGFAIEQFVAQVRSEEVRKLWN
ncbi:MAG: TRAP transporter small permease [Pseudomonadota bacterium]